MSGILIGALGCAQPKDPPSSGSTSIPTYQAPEPDYCSTVTNYTGTTTTVTGGATYQKRELVGGRTLGNPGAPRPIRHAEVRVSDANGNRVQCATTDDYGVYSFVVPRGTGTLTVSVRARSSNNSVKAFVYDDPRYNNLYSLSTTFVPNTATVSVATMNAPATGSVLGGAFNILDQIVEANDYLRAKAGNCSATFATCTNFTVADRVTVYWKLGFNPAEYFDRNASSGLSFYLPGYKRLFILGGINGDVDSSDTDHFDDAVILHEYGHFLEEGLTGRPSDSPGGSHGVNDIVDARLAWSEGWGNFFQAAVRGVPTYVDTIGNSAGSATYAIYLDLENQSGAHTGGVPALAGEGNFREFSVTRILWDMVDGIGSDSGGTDDVNDRFVEIYYSLTGPNGWLNPLNAFRQVGHFHKIQAVPVGATPLVNLRGIEKQTGTPVDFGQRLVTGSTCSYSATPNPSVSVTHPVANNDYFHIVHGGGTLAITLSYQDADGAGTKADLDLYLADSEARIDGSPATYAMASSIRTPSGAVTTPETESIAVNAAAGNYIIQVNTYFDTAATAGGTANYTLSLTSGGQLCPAP